MSRPSRFASLVFLVIASSAGVFAQPSVTVRPDYLASLQWRGIGPAATGGRIADIAVSKPPGSAAQIYIATTSGGLFKSSNDGVSFVPVFDEAGGMMSLGAVAVAPSNPAVVWVGTGEADNRQSSSWGDGVYKSVTGGGNWQKMGLADSRHIGRILISPADPNTVYVAAVGHLWGSNAERGVFKTTDGGSTWNKVLYRDENTGAIDLAMDPKDPQTVYAAMYQRQRKGWGYNGGGPGSGIFRTTDGGAHWTELKNGLPAGDKGRIGLATFPGDSRVVYAIVEADPAPAGRGDGEAGAPVRGGGISVGAGRAGRTIPTQQGGVFRSLDRGETWEHMSGINPRPSYYSRIYLDPKNSNRVYIMGSNRGFYVSDDAGRAFRDIFSGVHGEDHALWVDPDDTNHLVIGGDGGVSISFDRGLSWLMRLNLPIGQFYNISTNNQEPFLVCGGLQDNGSWCTPSASRMSHGVSFKDAFNIGGGDGMQALFEGDDRTVLVSSQNGVTQRLDLNNMQRQSIGPVQSLERMPAGPSPYRWYWTTPLIVSRFHSDTIYTGANILFRSDDRGVNWKPVSPDLTANVDRRRLQMMGGPVPPNALSRDDGQTNFSALTVIAESPLDGSVLYTGADDGTIQMTRDGGQHWTDLTHNVRGLPPRLNISGIVASKFSAGRVYLTVDGHFDDDYHAYIFVSEDYGGTWTLMVNGLPETSVHRLREHPSNPNFLVAGLETGAYATFDRGAHWTTIGGNLPPVPVYDLVFQESENALVLGTHGRSIYVLDHIEPLAQLTSEVVEGGPHLFPIPAAHHATIQAGQFWFGAGEFFAPNPAFGAPITYYLPRGGNPVAISISDVSGKTVRTLTGTALPGLNRVCWDLRMASAASEGPVPALAVCQASDGGRGGFQGPRVFPGKYTVTVTPAGAAPLRTEVTVSPDPSFQISDADRQARYASLMRAHALARQLQSARDTLDSLGLQLASIRQSVTTAAEGPRIAPEAILRVVEQVLVLQGLVGRSITTAMNVESAIDGYEGLPTGAQLRQLDWAWQDATVAVASLNQVLQTDMPSIYFALGSSLKWAPLPPVAAPERP